MPVKVGIVDSGIDAAPDLAVEAAVAFSAAGAPVAPVADALGHGTAVARIVRALAPAARLLNAQAFDAGRRAEAARVAQGIRWCLEQGARVVNLSLGLAADHGELRAACAAAAEQGVVVVASSPARGAPVFPAAYPGVIDATGDARCAPDTWSVLVAGRRYGAAPFGADGTPGGASYAAARLSGWAAAFLAAHPRAGKEDFARWLDAGAAYRGRERRVAGMAV